MGEVLGGGPVGIGFEKPVDDGREPVDAVRVRSGIRVAR
jgi:hypothetical protein